MTERAGRRCCLGWDFSTQQVRAGREWEPGDACQPHAPSRKPWVPPRGTPWTCIGGGEVTPGVHAEEESGLRVAGTQDTQRKQQSPQPGGGVRAC